MKSKNLGLATRQNVRPSFLGELLMNLNLGGNCGLMACWNCVELRVGENSATLGGKNGSLIWGTPKCSYSNGEWLTN